MNKNSLVKKGLVVAVIFLFISVSVIPSTGTVVDKQFSMPTNYGGDTLYVGGSGPGNYSKIQDAIDDANNGDTVFVYDDSSPYYENVVIDKSISLMGENKETTIIDGGGNNSILWENIIRIADDNVQINGLTLRNLPGITDNGIFCENYDNVHIENCIIHSCYNGIMMLNSENVSISNVVFFNNNNWDIQNYFFSKNHIIQGCNFSDSHCSISFDVENGVIKNCLFSNITDWSIIVDGSNSLVENNSFFDVGQSIRISGTNITCRNNIIENSQGGISFSSCSGNFVLDNILTNISQWWGSITLNHATLNYICGNIIINNDVGPGIGVDILSDSNVVIENCISNCEVGIKIHEALHNKFFHNTLINNIQNAYDEFNNTWDNGYLPGGNYYSDYAGDDFYHGPGQNKLGRDWRGDTPYNIAGGSNQDRYPLILPYESERPFAIIEHPSDGLITSEHNVTIIGYITDNVGLVKSGTSHAWDHVAITCERLHDELILHLDFEFVTELKPGWNAIGIHATDPSNNKGHDSVLVYYYPDIVYVDDDYNSSTQGWQQYCFNSIQDGVDVVAESGTVYVYNGTYYENVVIDKTINLIGENRDTTVIDGGGIGDVVVIHDDFVKISGFTIQNGAGAPGKYAGVHITSRNNEISHNVITQNNKEGIFVNGGSHNTICSNIITNNDESEGIIIRRANYNNIYKNDISSNVGGIEIYSSSNNSIYENNITANQHSITLYYSSNNSIVENDIIENYDGIYLFYSSQEFGFSSYNIISENKIKNNLRKGIYLYDTFSNTISDNDISGNLCGIELFHSNYTTILNNNVYDNLYGIFLNDTINRNHNNLVYHNNLINNNYQAKDNGDNTWNDDYPSGGNYWDDYIGEDNDGDGVGDIPYNISGGNNQDRYPLMEPYGMTKLTISMETGLFKFSGIIKNIGNKTAFNVQWKITIKGGLVLLGRESSGYLPRPLLAGEGMSVSSGLVFGFGRIVITVSVWADNAPLVSKSIPGFLFLFFIKIREGYRLTPILSMGALCK